MALPGKGKAAGKSPDDLTRVGVPDFKRVLIGHLEHQALLDSCDRPPSIRWPGVRHGNPPVDCHFTDGGKATRTAALWVNDTYPDPVRYSRGNEDPRVPDEYLER